MISRIVTLFICCFLSFSLIAQVGVNTSSPEQALDVNGKVKLGNDGTTPTDGTMRYNEAEGAFEGYAQGEWKALDAQGATPDQPIPFFASVYTTLQNEDYMAMEWQQAHGQSSFFFDTHPDPTARADGSPRRLHHGCRLRTRHGDVHLK